MVAQEFEADMLNALKSTAQLRAISALSDADAKNSFVDGILANMYAVLTGGAFLTGFGLFLGMNPFMIGLLGAIPFMATVFQLPAAYFVHKNGRRKKTCLVWSTVARTVWLPILITAFVPLPSEKMRLPVILVLLFVSHASASISYLAWMSWMSDLIPDKIRGSFFGSRNMLVGAGGMLAMMVFGRLLDVFNKHSSDGFAIGLCVTFSCAVLFGTSSLRFLSRVGEPAPMTSQRPLSFGKNSLRLLKEHNFKKFLAFIFCWSFAVYFASPFFSLHFLKNLNFSYTFVAILGTLSALADLLSMRMWGSLSDRVKNKSIIQVASWTVVFIPLAWISVTPDSRIVPVLLTILAGGCWAGISLCTNNLLLRISPIEEKGFYFSTFNIVAGTGAALAPITAGFLLKIMPETPVSVFEVNLLPIHLIFLSSTLMRSASLLLLNSIFEPEAQPISHLIRILRNVRGLNVVGGFNALLHPFLAIVPRKNRKSTEGH
jgi:Na+/melibiose symporter-like transporter